MSWKATAFVKELRNGLSVTEKFVLLMLAEYHRTDDRESWPSVRTLSDDCLMTERGVLQILARLEQGEFIRRVSGGGRGNRTAYQIVGLDVKKGAQQSVNDGAVNTQTVKQETVKHGDSLKETLHSHAENPAQPCNAIRKEQVLTGYTGGEGQPPLNLAQKVIEVLSLAESFTLKESIANAIKAEASYQDIEPHEAARFICAWCMEAQRRGIAVDKFTFQDTKWRTDGKRQVSAAESRSDRSKRAILDGLAADARRAASSNGPQL